MEILMCGSLRLSAFRLAILMLIAISQTSGFTISARENDLKQSLEAPDQPVGATSIPPNNSSSTFENDKIIKQNGKNETKMTTQTSGNKNITEINLANVKSVNESTSLEPKTVENKTLLDSKNYSSNSVDGDDKSNKQTDDIRVNETMTLSVNTSTNNTTSLNKTKQATATASIYDFNFNGSKRILRNSNTTTTDNTTKNINESKHLNDDKTYSTNSVISDQKSVPKTKTNLKGDTGLRNDKANIILKLNHDNGIGSTTELQPREITPWKNYKTIEKELTSTSPKESDNTPEKSATVEDKLPHDGNLKNLEVSTISDIRLDDTTRSTLPIEMLLSSTEPIKLETTTGVPTENTELITNKVMSSKRGGFLDLTTQSKDFEMVKSNENENLPTLDTTTNNPTTVQNAKSKSQVLMNDDAIRDELLMEKYISERQSTASRYAEEIKAMNDSEELPANLTAEADEKNGGRDLRVQPITKSLYEVNPNYRRMKKIDVVPAKPFVRDPDDNAWRNESLNSMGIVFKAKNSSKSFTEVIKSKTENEMPNFFGEGEDKADQPALRDRLEQLAEMRKSKKKKTEKGDETVNENEPTTYGAIKVIENYRSTVTVNPPTEKVKLDFFGTPDDENLEYYVPSHHRNIEIPTKSTGDISNIKQNVPYIDPNRKATIQYFPPKPVSVTVNEYDTNFNDKMKLFTGKDYNIEDSITTNRPKTDSTTPIDDDYLDTFKKVFTSTHNALFRNYFYRPTQMSRPTGTNYFLGNENMNPVEGFKVLMAEVGKDDDDEVEQQLTPQVSSYSTTKITTEPENDFNIIDRIIKGSQAVDLNMTNKQHFNGFPILYNNSVVHSDNTGKALASSTSFQRRDLADNVKPITRPQNILKQTKKFDANHDRFAVDIAQPSYELHYFLSDHEHNEET